MVPAAVIAGITGLAVTSTSVIIATIVVNLVISAIIGKILAPDAPPGTRSNKGLQTVIRSPISPRRVCYGEAVIGGPYIMLETIGVQNQTLNMIVVLTGHPIEDVVGVLLDDEYVNIAGNLNGASNDDVNDLDGNYWINTGKFGTGEAAGHVRIIKNLGWGYADNTYVTDEINFTESVNDRERGELIRDHITTPWSQPIITNRDSGTGLYADSGYKVTNCAYIMISLLYNRDVWSGMPKIKFHVKGKRLYDPSLDASLVSDGADSAGTHDLTDGETWEWSENWALCILDYLLDTSYGLAAKVSGQLTEINWAETITAINDAEELVPNGYDSPDAAMVPRYTTNGIFEVNATPVSTIESLLTSGAGALIYSQGEYKLRAGVYKLPESSTDIINEDMIVSPISIRTHTPRSDIFNKASGIYINSGYDNTPVSGSTNPASNTNKPIFGSADFPIVDPLDSSGLNPFEVIDGEEIIREFDYPFTIYEHEAQRLARIQLERVRQGLTIQFEADLQVLKFSVGDTVYLEILSDSKYANEAFFNRLGLDDAVQNRPDSPGTPYYKQFKIMDMEYTDKFTISVSLVEESEELYDWNEGDANKIDYVLESNLIIDDPTGTILQPNWDINDSPNLPIEEYESWPNKTTVLRWLAPERGSIVNALDRAAIGSYQVEYGIVTNPSNPAELRVDSWIRAGTTISNVNELIQGPISIQNLFVDEITEFEFRVRSITYLGRASLWSYYSDDIGSFYQPGAPRSAEISTPIAGQKTLIYDTQISSFTDSVGTTPGDFGVYDLGLASYNPDYIDIDRMFFNVTDTNNNENTVFFNALRNDDTVTLYISSKRWYKYRFNNTANPNSIATSGFPPPADSAVTVRLDGLELIDYKDSDSTNNDIITSNIEFRFERDTENDSLIEVLDGDFDRSFEFGSLNLGFWNHNAVTSPDSIELINGGGEDGSRAVDILVNPESGARAEVLLTSSIYFRNPSKDIEVTLKYQSISGTNIATNASRVFIQLFSEKYPQSRNDSPIDQSGTLYLPSTSTGEWNTVSTIIPRPGGKFIRFRISFQNDPIETEILDFLIDSVIVRGVDLGYGFETILVSNVATVNYNSSKDHIVDLGPASGNVTINILADFSIGESGIINIKTIQDTVDRTVTWQLNGSATPIQWSGGSQPSLTTGSGSEDYFTFRTLDGGTALIGSVIPNVQ